MMMMMIVFLSILSITNATCTSDIPTDGKFFFFVTSRDRSETTKVSSFSLSSYVNIIVGTNAVQLSFHQNSGGGLEGDDCPVACDSSTEVMRQYYQIAAADASCKQWPGNSGENAMTNGVCDTSDESFTYDQWTNCDCSGTIGSSKHVFKNRCVVDTPPTLCSQIIDYTACESDSEMTGHTVTWTTYVDASCTTLCPSGDCSTTLDLTLECNQNTESSQDNIVCEADKITYNNYPNTGSNSGNEMCVDIDGVFANELPVGVCTSFPGPVETWKLINADTYNCTPSPSPSSSPSPSPSPSPSSDSSSDDDDTARYVGISIGAVVAVILIVALYVATKLRKKN